MKISIIQMGSSFKNIDDNYQKLSSMLKKIENDKTDVIVLPETWSTGFFPEDNIEKYADVDGKKIKEFFSDYSLKNNVNVVAGSVITKKNDGIFNTSYIFDRKGNILGSYDKIHLFSPMDEDKFFSSGNKIVTFDLDGVSCGIVICYDIRFPELIRILSLKGIKILFVVAHWPKLRLEHWEILNRVRAIENQIFLVAVNSCSIRDNTIFAGNSLAVDPWGNYITKLSEKEEVITFDINLDQINEIRQNMNIYKDRKENIYKLF